MLVLECYYYSCFFLSVHSLLYAEMQFINCMRSNVKCSIAQYKCRPMSYIGHSTAIQIPMQCVWNELTLHYTHFNQIDALRTNNFRINVIIELYFYFVDFAYLLTVTSIPSELRFFFHFVYAFLSLCVCVADLSIYCILDMHMN